MEQINNFLENFTLSSMINFWIAIGIILIFRIFSSGISYIVIRMFKFKIKNAREIKESAFYDPLRVFISILGIYIAILFVKEPFGISSEIMAIVTKGFKIISIIAFAKGFAKSFTAKSTLVKNIREKMNQKVEDNSFKFILKMIRGAIYVVAGFMVISELGINLNGLIAGVGLGGVILTLAAQDTAKNLFGGLVIFMDKPFVVGDWIQMDTFEGTVEDITFRSTRIRTFENSVVNVPNSIISNTSIINWSRMEKRRYKIDLCLELNTPLEKIQTVEQKIYDMLEQYDRIIDDSIMVRFDKITENGINLLVYSYTNSVDYASFIEEKEKINYKIMQILRDEKINIAYDTKTIHIQN